MLDVFHKAPTPCPSALFSVATVIQLDIWPAERLVLFKGQKRNKNHMRDGPGAYRAYGLSGNLKEVTCVQDTVIMIAHEYDNKNKYGHQLSKPNVISQLEQEELSLMTKEFPGCISPGKQVSLEGGGPVNACLLFTAKPPAQRPLTGRHNLKPKNQLQGPALLKIYPMGPNLRNWQWDGRAKEEFKQ
ncbi:hypothetical protein HPG69_012072 [Diceros bicornis minor]|uniref:Uncharacterized protein n=1 Tax=Diceros bicornis minor TaxID=77932 RepID=A0A7J7EY26_DICBM|nr:hypothetical protein HPG69_012072 [Diceros bicornis minor]